VDDWGVKGTGPISLLDGIDYKHRILAPITLNEKVVSFQARDITNKSHLKYMACPKRREIIDHKHTLYGLDQCSRTHGLVVEGIFDVWRLGPGAVATFGIEFTKQQVCLLVDRFARVTVVFDDDRQAIKQARKLQAELEIFGVPTDIIRCAGDPDTFSDAELDEIRQHVSK